MLQLPPRTLNLLGFLACAGMMAFALFMQYALALEPCPLCILQRIAVIAAGGFFLLGALHNPGPVGVRIYGGLALLASLAGIGVAGRQVWLQHLPPEQVPSCGPGLDYMMEVFPLTEVLGMILRGSGECAEIAAQWLGLSIPEWTLIGFVALSAWTLLVIRNAAARH